ncbi:MAG: RDD family protein, partial [Acidimicrobiales bacterium]
MSAYQAPSDPTAVVAKRYAAAFIDWGIGVAVAVVLFFALSKSVTHYSYSSFNSSGGYTTSRELTGIGAVIYYAWILSYNVGVFVLWRGLTGRTTGTIAMGLVTVNEQGRPLGPGYALLRSVAGIVDYIPCCLPIVGIATVASTKGHRRVGDMAAKSFV